MGTSIILDAKRKGGTKEKGDIVPWPAPRKLVQPCWESYDWPRAGGRPSRKRPAAGQIAEILRPLQADLDSGSDIDRARREAGIGIATHCRREATRGDPISNEHLRLSELEAEDDRLGPLVAEPAPDARMLEEASGEKP